MEIAVLGWGSLVWDPRELKIKGRWKHDGPHLPIEYARISKGKRLTLVLHPKVKRVRTLWAYSVFNNLNKAIRNLREREDIPIKATYRIGYVSIHDCKINSQAVHCVGGLVQKWAREKGLDAVVWTDLTENPEEFRGETGMELNDDNIIKYLKSLEGETLEKAKEYVQKAPEQVGTKLGRRIKQELNW